MLTPRRTNDNQLSERGNPPDPWQGGRAVATWDHKVTQPSYPNPEEPTNGTSSNTSRPEPLGEDSLDVDEVPGSTEAWQAAFVRDSKSDGQPTPSDFDGAMQDFARHHRVNLPGHLQFSQGSREHDAVERIKQLATDRVLITRDTDTTYLRGFDGLWFPLDNPRSRQAIAVTYDLIESTAKLAAEAARKEIAKLDRDDYWHRQGLESYPIWLEQRIIRSSTNSLCREVASKLASLSAVASVRDEPARTGVLQHDSADLSDYDRHRVIPLNKGGAISLETLSVETADQIAYLLLGNFGWKVPAPNFSLTQPASFTQEATLIVSKYSEILVRLSYHLVTTSKVIDVIRVPQSNWGKSTLSELVDLALPGMVARTALRVLSARSQFTPAAKYMATKRLVFFDEAGSDKTELSMTRWMELADRQHIETKGMDAYDAKRTATAILVGQSWPALDTSVPGVEQRIQWAFTDNSQTQMTSAEREMILSPSGVEFARAYLIVSAHRHLVNGTTGVTPASRQAVAQLIASESNDLVDALKSFLEEGGPADIVSNAELKGGLETQGVEAPGGQILKRTILQIFREAMPFEGRSQKHGGQKLRGFSGVRIKSGAKN